MYVMLVLVPHQDQVLPIYGDPSVKRDRIHKRFPVLVWLAQIVGVCLDVAATQTTTTPQPTTYSTTRDREAKLFDIVTQTPYTLLFNGETPVTATEPGQVWDWVNHPSE